MSPRLAARRRITTAWPELKDLILEVLYFLLPLSLLFIGLIGAVLWWAVFSGQYEDPDHASRSILDDDDRPKRP